MASIREDFNGVTIVRDAAGQDHILGPGAEIPKGIVVGDHLLASPSKRDSKNAEPAAGTAENTVPRKGGAGSGAPAWRKYAVAEAKKRGLNIDIPEDASRDDIISALDEAQIPTE